MNSDNPARAAADWLRAAGYPVDTTSVEAAVAYLDEEVEMPLLRTEVPWWEVALYVLCGAFIGGLGALAIHALGS